MSCEIIQKCKGTTKSFFALIFFLSSCNNLQNTASTTTIETTTPLNIAATAKEEAANPKIEYIKLIDQIGHGVIFDLAWHPLNTKIAVATPLGIRFHHPDTLAEIDFWATPEPIMSLIYKSDGEFISGNGSGILTFWDEDGKGVGLQSRLDNICDLVLSPDEKWLAILSCRQGQHGLDEQQKVAIWNLEDQSFQGFLQTQKRLLVGVTFSPGSDTVSVYEVGHGVCTWNLSDLSNPVSCISSFCDGLPCGPYKVIASPDGTRIAVYGPFGGVYDKQWDDNEKRYFPVRTCDTCTAYGIGYSTDVKTLIAGVEDNIYIFDVFTGEIIVENNMDSAQIFSFSPNGEKFVAVTQFGKLSLFDTETVYKLAESNDYLGEIVAIAVSPDQSQFVSGYTSGIIDFWRIFPLALLNSLEIDMRLDELDYDSDGQRIHFRARSYNWAKPYLVGTTNGIIKTEDGDFIYELIDSDFLLSEDGFPSKVSPDGKILVSGTEDETIIIRNPQTGHELGEFQAQAGTITALGIVQNEDEYWILVGGTNGLVNIWAVKLLND